MYENPNRIVFYVTLIVVWIMQIIIIIKRSYLKDYESVVEEKAVNDEEFIERVVGNPIHSYRLMKRLYFDSNLVLSV